MNKPEREVISAYYPNGIKENVIPHLRSLGQYCNTFFKPLKYLHTPPSAYKVLGGVKESITVLSPLSEVGMYHTSPPNK